MPPIRAQGERLLGKQPSKTCRFHIRSGQVDVEYEGSESFAVERLLPAIERLSQAQLGMATRSPSDSASGSSPQDTAMVPEGPHPTTREIAEKLRAEDWDSVALAACGHLTLARQLPSYSQDQILEQMRLGPDCSTSEMQHALDRILKGMMLGAALFGGAQPG